jgi:hypothetical protein
MLLLLELVEQLIIQNGTLHLHQNTLQLNQVTIELQLNTNAQIILLQRAFQA